MLQLRLINHPFVAEVQWYKSLFFPLLQSLGQSPQLRVPLRMYITDNLKYVICKYITYDKST